MYALKRMVTAIGTAFWCYGVLLLVIACASGCEDRQAKKKDCDQHEYKPATKKETTVFVIKLDSAGTVISSEENLKPEDAKPEESSEAAKAVFKSMQTGTGWEIDKDDYVINKKINLSVGQDGQVWCGKEAKVALVKKDMELIQSAYPRKSTLAILESIRKGYGWRLGCVYNCIVNEKSKLVVYDTGEISAWKNDRGAASKISLPKLDAELLRKAYPAAQQTVIIVNLVNLGDR